MNKETINKIIELLLSEQNHIGKESDDFIQGKKRMIVLSCGWIHVGNVFKNGDMYKVTNVMNCESRRHGSKGFGECVIEGPKTLNLQSYPDIEFHESQKIFITEPLNNWD